MTKVGQFNCELRVAGDVVLATHIKDESKHSAEVCALVPTLQPLAFSICIRMTDYYTFNYGFAVYIFIDGAHHINGCWSGRGEGKGVFRGRQKTVDGRAVIDGEWRLGSNGVEVVQPQLSATRGSMKVVKDKKKKRRKGQSTIEVVILRIERDDGAEGTNSASGSEADIEIARGSAAVGPSSYTWRNPLHTPTNSDVALTQSGLADARIREFERAIGRSRRDIAPGEQYVISDTSSNTQTKTKGKSRNVEQLRDQLAQMLPSLGAHESKNTIDLGKASHNAHQPAAVIAPHASPVKMKRSRTGRDHPQTLTPRSSSSSQSPPSAQDVNKVYIAKTIRNQGSKRTHRSGNSQEKKSRRRKQRKSMASESDSSTENSSSSSSSASDDSAAEHQGNHSTDSGGTASSSSDSDTTSSSPDQGISSSTSTSCSDSSSQQNHRHKKTKNKKRSKHQKPHKLFRKHWQYHDKSLRSRTFGGKHARPPYQARHRVTPVWIDTMERPYAIFKFRIANAELLQSEQGLSAEDVDQLRLGRRQRERILNALNADELRELVRSGAHCDASAAARDFGAQPKRHRRRKRASLQSSPSRKARSRRGSNNSGKQSQEAQSPPANDSWGASGDQPAQGGDDWGETDAQPAAEPAGDNPWDESNNQPAAGDDAGGW